MTDQCRTNLPLPGALPTLLLAALLVLSAGCQQELEKVPPKAGDERFEEVFEPASLDAFPGRLGQGQPALQPHDRPPLAETVPLSEQRVRELLERLEPLPEPPDDQTDFALRRASEPPPRTGASVHDEFPPAAERELPEPEPPEGPLTVLRFQPEGEVPIAGQVAVTFDRPMVAVSGHADTVAESVPAVLSPEVPGNWRWAGTRTLLFEPAGARLPMATEFEVVVAAGTQAADGSVLEGEHRWTFATPPMRLVEVRPAGTSIGLEPVMLVAFDQAIDPAALLEALEVTAAGESVAIRPAGEAEIMADPILSRVVERLEPGRFLAFRAVDPLPRNAAVRVAVPAGIPSYEGPRPTTERQEQGFRTYGPLLVTNKRCGSRACRPDEALVLVFSNALEEDQALGELIEVEPEIPGMHVWTRGSELIIEGLKQGQAEYTVRLAPGLTDRFAQQLSGSREFRFHIGSFQPRFVFPARGLVTLDARERGELQFFSTNYRHARVRVHRVLPTDWPAWMEAARGGLYWRDELPQLPGEPVHDVAMALNAEPDRIAQHRLALDEWLDEDGYGHLIVVVEPGETIGPEPRYGRQRHAAWVQVTSLGLDAAADHANLLVWATELADGTPLEDIEIRLGATGVAAATDSQGLATLDLPSGRDGNPWLEARRGNDQALLPDAGSWRARSRADSVLWYVFDDRDMYRPGEQVHLKGWVRREQRRPDGGLDLIGQARSVNYRVTDTHGNELAGGSTEVAGLGGFDLSFELPDTPNLGPASVQLDLVGAGGLGGTSHRHRFQIQEFRTPEFEVTTRVDGAPFVGSGLIRAEVEAGYYAGGGLPGADTTWQVSARPGQFRPPNRDDWSFGFQPPWWMPWPVATANGSASERFDGQTDSGGRHVLDIELNMAGRLQPLSVTAAATVMDVNRQAWRDSSDFLVHPGQVYVGMKTDSQFVASGEPLRVELVTVDLDGQAASEQPISVEAARVHWHWRHGGREEQLADIQHCRVHSDADGLAACEFRFELGGQYRITAITRDQAGRRNGSRIIRWAGGARLPAPERVEMEQVLLVPEHEEYAPGDTARVLVQAPFDNGEGLMTLRRHGLAEQRRFSISGGEATLEIPIRGEWMPNIELHVTVVGLAEREGGQGTRPAIASGRMALAITTAERVLEVELTPADREISPGTETTVDLVVRDADGRPVPDAELALVVVDEAILALTGYQLPDPLELFYRQRPGEVTDHHLRPTLLLVGPELSEPADTDAMVTEAMADQERAQVTGTRMFAAAPDDSAEPITMREDFNPLAAFVPALLTDGEGRARADIRLPDNLTRYRVMAVAVADATRYGKAESAITARLPLMVRPSAPRFLNFGDEFEFPVVLQNQTDDILAVEVALDTTNLARTGTRGFALEVPPRDRVEVRFPAGTINAGTARYQVAAATADFADAARGQLPVWTPATSEAFATYGTIDQGGIIQPVAAPSDIWPQFGQLEITTSATALQSLTDAFIWLCDYPFTVTEALASRLLAIAALADVLAAFGAEGVPDADELQAIVRSDLEALVRRQNPDGGFGLWQRGNESWPFVTLHVAHALVRIRARGYEIDADFHDRTLRQVRNIEQHIPVRYSAWTRRHVIAYALYVRGLDGDFDRERARSLLAEADGLDEFSLEALGWLLGVLAGDQASSDELAQIRRFLNNRVSETAASAQFDTAWRDGAHLVMHSSRRADAVILEALMSDQPGSDLIPKLVTGLQAHRTRGRWSSTQENAFVLLALDRYFRQYEAQEPDFIARAWLGQDFAGEHAFIGRTTESHQVDIPMAWLIEADQADDLVLHKGGAGRLYYRIGLRYAPKSLELAAASHGFEVDRRYHGLDNEDDVRRLDDGSWEIRAGARVEVELTLVAPARRYHVALVDPLPAGLESINPALAVSDTDHGGEPEPLPYGRWWWGPWYQHQNLRDERSEAFTTLLPGGVYQYRYHARATTPGHFVVPPAKAEEMYHPETFGRSASDRVRVVD